MKEARWRSEQRAARFTAESAGTFLWRNHSTIVQGPFIVKMRGRNIHVRLTNGSFTAVYWIV